MPIKKTVTVYNKDEETKVVRNNILLGATPYEFKHMEPVEIPQRAWTHFRYRYKEWMVTGVPDAGCVQQEAKRRGRPRKIQEEADADNAG